MIALEQAQLTVSEHGRLRQVVDLADFEFPARRIALIGHRGSGKSPLLSMLSGYLHPTRGRVRRLGRTTWPIGRIQQFRSGAMTGIETTRLVCRLYGLEFQPSFDFLKLMLEDSAMFTRPMAAWSSLQRLQYGWAASLLLPFDAYLFDGAPPAVKTPFGDRWREAFAERLKGAQGLIMAANRPQPLVEFCDCAVLIHDRKLTFFDNLLAAQAHLATLPAPKHAAQAAPRDEEESEFDDDFA